MPAALRLPAAARFFLPALGLHAVVFTPLRIVNHLPLVVAHHLFARAHKEDYQHNCNQSKEQVPAAAAGKEGLHGPQEGQHVVHRGVLRSRLHRAFGGEHGGNDLSLGRSIGQRAHNFALGNGGAQVFVVGDGGAGAEICQRLRQRRAARTHAPHITAVAQLRQAQFQQAALGVVAGSVGDGHGVEFAAAGLEEVFQQVRLVLRQAVVKQLFGVFPLLRGFAGSLRRAHHHGNQKNAVAFQRAHKALPGAAVKTGFDADAALVVIGAVRIHHFSGGDNIVLPAVDRGSHGIRGGGSDFAEGLVLHGLLSDERQVVSGGIVRVVVIAVGVGKVCARAADLSGALVHHGHEIVDAAAHQVGNGVGAVVSGFEHGAIQQIAESHHLAGEYRHNGAVRGDVLRHLRDGHFLIKGYIAFQGQQNRHDFGGAGRIHAHQGILVKKHVAIAAVHQHGRLRVKMALFQRPGLVFIPVVGRDGISRPPKGGKRQHNQHQERKRPASHGKILL